MKEKLQQIEEYIHQLDAIADPVARDSAHQLIQLLMDLHGSSLQRVMEMLWETGEPGAQMIDRFGEDELLGPLLLLFNLHPLDLQTRVFRALEKVRPYLKSHGGNVELVHVSEQGDVELQLQGSCHGCPSSAMTLKLAIEEAIYEAAPDLASLTVQGVVQQKSHGDFIPIQQVQMKKQDGWQEVGGLEGMNQGDVRIMRVHGKDVLFCRINESYYAYSSHCPDCAQPLQDAYLSEAASLVCGKCGQKYDALRAGRGLDKPSLHLEPFPLLLDHERIKISLPV